MLLSSFLFFFFFFNDPATPEISPLPLHDALPIPRADDGLHDPPLPHPVDRRTDLAVEVGLAHHVTAPAGPHDLGVVQQEPVDLDRSEEHTSELQSLAYLVCRLLLEKKKNN